MAISEGLPFYAPLPEFGVPLSRQWDKFRQDFNALAPIVRGAVYDVGSTSQRTDLTGLSIGELDFRNRHRVYYNKTDNQFEIQYNQGSQNQPSWTTYMKIRDSDGRLIACGPGGFSSVSGFYNASFLTVRESAPDTFKHDGISDLVFNSNNFYLTGPRTKPQANLKADITVDSGNVLISADGNYVRAADSLIGGDPGFEGDSISVGGNDFESVLKASDIGSQRAAILHLHRHSNSLPVVLIGSRSRGETSSHSTLQDGDTQMSIISSGWGDSTYEVGASINFITDAIDGSTPGDDNMPTRIDFRTKTPGGANSLVMSLHPDQHVSMESSLNVGNAVTAEAFYLSTGGGVTDYPLDLYREADMSMYDASARAQRYLAGDQLDIEVFANDWITKGSLPALPSKKDKRNLWDNNDYITALIETVETQAVHIHKLNERLKKVEKTTSELEPTED